MTIAMTPTQSSQRDPISASIERAGAADAAALVRGGDPVGGSGGIRIGSEPGAMRVVGASGGAVPVGADGADLATGADGVVGWTAGRGDAGDAAAADSRGVSSRIAIRPSSH